MADRCTIHSLPVADLADAVADPGLAALLGEGWEVLASVVVDAGDGRGPRLQLLLRPPRAPIQAGWWLYAAIALGALAVGSSVGHLALSLAAL